MTGPNHQGLIRRLRSKVTSLRRLLCTAAWWQLILAASGWITLLGVTVLPPGSPPRALLVFGFVLACPGLAVSGLLPAREPAERWVLAIALSTSLAIVVTVVLTVLRIGSVALRLELLALITTIAVCVDIGWSCRDLASPPTANERTRP